MTVTLYESNQAACDDLARRGYKAIAGMTKYFHRNSEMSRALGFAPDGSAVSKWLRGDNNPEWKTEARAANWLLSNQDAASPFPDPPEKNADPTTMLMVVCDNTKLEKVQKILAMIGCEVVEI